MEHVLIAKRTVLQSITVHQKVQSYVTMVHAENQILNVLVLNVLKVKRNVEMDLVSLLMEHVVLELLVLMMLHINVLIIPVKLINVIVLLKLNVLRKIQSDVQIILAKKKFLYVKISSANVLLENQLDVEIWNVMNLI